MTPHVLRQTAATWMVRHGVPLEMVTRYLGNTKAMVERVYGHHSPEWLRQAAEALSHSMGEKTQIAAPGYVKQNHGAAGQD